jgi:hypothetical protein
LILVLYGGSREQELRFAALLGPGTTIYKVDGALKAGYFPNGKLVLGRTILPEVRAGAFSLDHQRFRCQDSVFSTHSLGRRIYQASFRGLDATCLRKTQ